MKQIEADGAFGAQQASWEDPQPETPRQSCPQGESTGITHRLAFSPVTLSRTENAERANTERTNTGETNTLQSRLDVSAEVNGAGSLEDHRSQDSALFCEIQRLLCQLQSETALTHRFQLFVESVQSAPNETGDRTGRACPIFSRITYSPTLHASNQDQKSRLAEICQKVTEFSFAKVPLMDSPNNSGTNRSQAQTSHRATRIALRRLGPPKNSEARNQFGANVTSVSAFWTLRIHEGLEFPCWCPFQSAEYTVPPQASSERLFISKIVLDRFNALEDFQVVWIYQEHFKLLYRTGRKKRKTSMARTLTYSEFTPPRIHRLVAAQLDNPNDVNGHNVAESITLKKIAISHLRNERNIQGYRRVRFILTAFFCHESETVKSLIEHLFQIVPSRRAASRRKPGQKRSLPDGPHQDSTTQRRRQIRAETDRRIQNTTRNARNTEHTSQEQLNGHTTSQAQQNSGQTVSIQQESTIIISQPRQQPPEDTSEVNETTASTLQPLNKENRRSSSFLPQLLRQNKKSRRKQTTENQKKNECFCF